MMSSFGVRCQPIDFRRSCSSFLVPWPWSSVSRRMEKASLRVFFHSGMSQPFSLTDFPQVLVQSQLSVNGYLQKDRPISIRWGWQALYLYSCMKLNAIHNLSFLFSLSLFACRSPISSSLLVAALAPPWRRL
jgi:hypothetical protein